MLLNDLKVIHVLLGALVVNVANVCFVLFITIAAPTAVNTTFAAADYLLLVVVC